MIAGLAAGFRLSDSNTTFTGATARGFPLQFDAELEE